MISKNIENDLSAKVVFTSTELCKYAKISKSFLYKLTSQRLIPFSKPFGKLIYFKKSDVDAFLLQNRKEAITLMNVELPVLKGGRRQW